MTKRLTAQQIANRAEAMRRPELTQMLLLVADVDTTPQRRKILATKCLPDAPAMSQAQKVEYAGVGRKTWYRAERDPRFTQLCVDFTRERMGTNAPEFWSRYAALALDGDRQALEHVLEQLGILDKPQLVRAGDTNIALTVTVEQKIKLEQQRAANQRVGLESLGYTLHTDN